MSFLSYVGTVLSGFLIVVLFVMTYIAFAIFFCLSIQCLLSYLLAFVSFSLLNEWIVWADIFLSLIIFVPFMHLLFAMNFQIIFSYFRKIWHVLSFKGIREVVLHDFEDKSKKNLCIKAIKYIFLILVTVDFIAVLYIEISQINQTRFQICIAILSVIPLLIGFFKVLWKSFVSLFKNPEPQISSNKSSTFQTLIDENSEQSLTELNDEPQETEIKQSLFDPCGMMNQIEYFNFINDPSVNHFASFFKHRKFNVKMIPGIISTILIIAFLLINFILEKDAFSDTNYFYLIILILRSVVLLFCIPFLAIFTFTNLFVDSKEMKEKHIFIRKMYIFVLFGYIIGIFALYIFLIVCNEKITSKPVQYAYDNSTHPVTISEPASMCRFKYHDLDLIQLSAISALGQSFNIPDHLYMLKYLFNYKTTMKSSTIYWKKYCFFHVIDLNSTLKIVIFNSNINITRTTFLVENFIKDFLPNKLFTGIIPFYSLTYDLFLSRFFNFLPNYFNHALSIVQISDTYASIANNFIIEEIKKLGNATVLYIGHSIGGMLAKAIGSHANAYSIAFESPNNDHSMFNANAIAYSKQIKYELNGYKMVNVYSPSQLFSQHDTNSTTNFELPKWKNIYESINPYEELCMIAAGCDMTGQYDNLCRDLIGMDNYLNLFALWNRTRS